MESIRLNKNLLFLSFLAIIILFLLISSCALNIEKLKDKQDVEGLIKALRYVEVGYAATEALIEIGEPAIEPLIEALGDENSWVQSSCSRCSGENRRTGCRISN